MKNPCLGIEGQKFILSVLSRERVGGLRQIICSEREKLRQMGKISGSSASPDRFNHAAKLEGQAESVTLLHFIAYSIDTGSDTVKLLHRDHLRHHDFGANLNPRFQTCGFSFKNSADLHVVDLGIGHSDANPSVSEHGIDFMQIPDLSEHAFLLGDDAVDVLFAGFVISGVIEMECPKSDRSTFNDETVFFKRLNVVDELLLTRKEFMHGRV